MTQTERAAYEDGFRDALCEAFEWQEYAERLERRCERLQRQLWTVVGIQVAFTVWLLWIER